MDKLNYLKTKNFLIVLGLLLQAALVIIAITKCQDQKFSDIDSKIDNNRITLDKKLTSQFQEVGKQIMANGNNMSELKGKIDTLIDIFGKKNAEKPNKTENKIKTASLSD